MKIGESVGSYKLVHRRNDPIAGEVWIFQDQDLRCYEWKAWVPPSVEDIDLKAGK